MCTQDTPAAEKMRQLSKEKFDGRVGEGLELLGQLCDEDNAVLMDLDQQMETLETKIEGENQLIGNIREIREQQKALEKSGNCWRSLRPKMQQAEAQYRQAEQDAAHCGQLTLLDIEELRKSLDLFDKLHRSRQNWQKHSRRSHSKSDDVETI